MIVSVEPNCQLIKRGLKETDSRFEKFGDLLLKVMRASLRVADHDEKLGERVYGLYLETGPEMLRVMRAKGS